MELYKSLIEMMDVRLRKELLIAYEKEPSLPARLIVTLANHPDITEKALQKQFALSGSMWHKTLTRVKDLLWEFNAKHVRTSYDDIFVFREMLLSGKTKNGIKFFNALKKEYDTRQQWDKLECLYTEGLRYAQITGNEQLAARLSAERKQNGQRLHAYITVYSDIILEMIRMEGYSMKHKEAAEYIAYIDRLYAQANELSHHLLIHNSLHIRYLFWVRYRNEPDEVFRIISEIKDNAEKNKHRMADMTYAIAMNNYVNFLTIYRSFGAPDEFIRPLKKVIHHGGSIAVFNFYYSILEYFLFEQRLDEARKWMAEFKDFTDESKFAQYRHIASALRYFIERDFKACTESLNRFYADPSYHNFPDMEITLRLLSIIICLQKKEGDLAASRLDTLRMFMSRNVEKDRYRHERKIISLLGKINEGRKDIDAELSELMQTPYRNIYFLATSICEVLLLRRPAWHSAGAS